MSTPTLNTVAVGLACLVGGCTSPERFGMIPLGKWEGHGVFVYENWQLDEETATQPAHLKSMKREYPTSLFIERITSDGQDFLVLEILSERGMIPGAGERTFIRAALFETKSVANGATLYSIADWKFNPEPSNALALKRPDGNPQTNASCLRIGDVIVLHIQYLDHFADTLRFRNDGVVKDGIFYNKDGGLIHWSELLKRR